MKLSDLKYEYPESLIARERLPGQSRILLNRSSEILEILKPSLMELFLPGDILVINNTKVEKRRVFGVCGKKEFEILFVEKISDTQWNVLFPASRLKKNQKITLPGGIELSCVQSGIPQRVELSGPLSQDYFDLYGELPLPPYIQKARGERHNQKQDGNWYQTQWAEKSGSQAAPTASLHFSNEDLQKLKAQGVGVEVVTLHVGLGTFLPIKTECLDDHRMHEEWCSLSDNTYQRILEAKKNGNKIWALGTTVARTLESVAHGKLVLVGNVWSGTTNLFIKQGFDFRVVDCLLTNFHQPETTLLALVATFAGIENVKKTYSYAIKQGFRLFSYGDLTVWVKQR